MGERSQYLGFENQERREEVMLPCPLSVVEECFLCNSFLCCMLLTKKLMFFG